MLRTLDSDDPRFKIARFLHVHAEEPFTAAELVDIDNGTYAYPPDQNHQNRVYGYMDDLEEMGVVTATDKDGTQAWQIAEDIDPPPEKTVDEYLFQEHSTVTTVLVVTVSMSAVAAMFGVLFGLSVPVSWTAYGFRGLFLGTNMLGFHTYMAHRDTDTALQTTVTRFGDDTW